MAYKVVNNTLDFKYWVSTVTSIYSFKKIKISDIFNAVKEEKIQEDSNKVSNIIVNNAILNLRPTEDILKDLPDDDHKDEIIDNAKKIAEPIIKKVKHQQEILDQDITWSEQDVWDKKAIKIANDIEVRLFSDQNPNYINKIKKMFDIIWNTRVCEYLDNLFKYKDSSDLTWHDVWVIARSINWFFSNYFQSLFIEESKMKGDISDEDLEEWDARNALDKIRKDQNLDIYDMFKFVNWVQENSRTDFITKLGDQCSKDKFNLLKCFLDSEAYNWIIKWSFYTITLKNLRLLRNFHAHHDDTKNESIKKLMSRNTPDKIRIKLYNKFLWDLDENWKWFLQFIIERM